ncbi:MAG TPA: hypothetical protein VFF04_04295 [Candidatus Babeliales bacterium]|nr:hypothetical protein [Candidatus Babeliales bacterium]
MNNTQLLHKFSQGINWNAFVYILYKGLFTILSLLLFSHLTTIDFSTWANINSIIFLVLLWLDGGLRKSLPRYCPEFARNAYSYKRFITAIIIFQAALLLVALPFFIYLVNILSRTLHLNSTHSIVSIASLIFLTEGFVSVLRLLYHSHFWQKEFNILHSIILIAEMLLNGYLIFTISNSSQLLQSILITKLLSSALLVIIAGSMITQLYNATELNNEPINANALHKAFIRHSAIMWFNTSIKSISERNFMIPLLTYILGPAPANLFKIANDGALLFYRPVVKTIGTTDTSLLTYATNSQEPHQLTHAFSHLCHKLITICLPLLGLISLLIISFNTSPTNQFIIQAFGILTLGYLFEALLSPYERILEVNGNYLNLFISYIPYIAGMAFMLLNNNMNSVGLLGCILLMQTIRLSGSSLMVYFAQKQYQLPLPVKSLEKIALMIIPLYIIGYTIITMTGTTHYCSLLLHYLIKLK